MASCHQAQVMVIYSLAKPLLSGLPTPGGAGGGGGAFCHFWVGLVGPLSKISLFPTGKVSKSWVGGSPKSTPPLPLVSKGLSLAHQGGTEIAKAMINSLEPNLVMRHTELP